ncbi:MAG TPA: hypothetical protein VFT22_31870 [Kofleriaceae bacterium]|nr:hypothetical protein [Kofleriaceae bacterium]
MDEIRIDQLTLKLSGLTEHDGRRLVRMITEGLAAAEIPPGARGSLGALRVGLAGADTGNLEALSRHVVREVLRQIQRSA